MPQISYAKGEIQVGLGDHILYRSMFLWWRWKPGRISYVPGQSKLHPGMEFNGLQWVGVSGDDGTYRAVIVLPETRRLKTSIQFVKRTSDDLYLTPDKIPEDHW